MIFGPWKSLLCLHPFHVEAKCPIDFVWVRWRVSVRETARHGYKLENERRESWWAACVLKVVLSEGTLCSSHKIALPKGRRGCYCYRSSASIEHELVINKLTKLCATLLLLEWRWQSLQLDSRNATTNTANSHKNLELVFIRFKGGVWVLYVRSAGIPLNRKISMLGLARVLSLIA